MTGLEKIIHEIQKSALAEAEGITNEAKAEAKKILGDNKAKVEKRAEKITTDASNMSVGIVESTASNVQLQTRQELLAVKQGLIGTTIDQAREAVVALDEQSYLELFSKMAAKTDSQGGGKLILNQRDREKLGKELISKFPENEKITLADETADILGGFLLVSGNVTVNCSIEAIFADNHDRISDTIKQVLFDD